MKLLPPNAAAYWTEHNVTNHSNYASARESRAALDYRNAQYHRYIDLMPVNQADDLDVLDFGCGPGHDLVGFGLYSKPKRLVGVDVSASSLTESARRLKLHTIKAELVQHDAQKAPLPFKDGSFDLVHSSGVLHHMEDPATALKEFRRVLKKGGRAQIMVYNRNSLWMHLYVAYQRQIVEKIDSRLSAEDAFRASTDGPGCPISRNYTKEEFTALAEKEGFKLDRFDVAVSNWEMMLLPCRFEAIMHAKLPKQSRDFLIALTFDERCLPKYGTHHAGIDGCYSFSVI